MTGTGLSMGDISLAKKSIASIALRTPLIHSFSLSKLADTTVYLKPEGLQPTGSFKIRGAANRMLHLTKDEKDCGVIAVSTGNHGRAVAYVAGLLGLRAVICLSQGVPGNKVQALRRLGAETVVHGRSYDEAMAHACSFQVERGLAMIHPFDDPLVIAGQGPIGQELLEDLPAIDTVIVPLSGGGLMSGIAFALKSAQPSIRVVGVSMDRAPVMVRSLRAGEVIEMEEEETLADALVGGIGPINRYTFRLCQRYVDEALLVSEEEIADAMAFCFEEHGLVVEGGGAVGVATLLSGKMEKPGRNVAVVLSGSNVDPSLLLGILQRNRTFSSEAGVPGCEERAGPDRTATKTD